MSKETVGTRITDALEKMIRVSREVIITRFVDIAEKLIRDSDNSIFHDGQIIHSENHQAAVSPSFSQLMQSIIVRLDNCEEFGEYEKGKDPITSFYLMLPGILGQDFSVYPAFHKEHSWSGRVYCWENAMIQRLTESGMSYLETPITVLWLQYALTGEIKCENDEKGILAPVLVDGVAAYSEISIELSKRFDADYQKGLDAKAAKEEAKRNEALAETVGDFTGDTLTKEESLEPKGVAHLLMETPAETVSDAGSAAAGDDPFDLSALDALNIDEAADRVDAKRSGGGEAIVVGEGDNDCGDGCKI